MKPRRLQSATILSMVTTSSGMAADGRPPGGQGRVARRSVAGDFAARPPLALRLEECQGRPTILYPARDERSHDPAAWRRRAADRSPPDGGRANRTPPCLCAPPVIRDPPTHDDAAVESII